MKKYIGILFFVIILISLLIRLVNINANSPHTDEAIYQVIGRLGVFHRDWGTLNAGQWMAGDAYLYPSIAALTSQIGGVLGSRVFNVILGVFSLVYVYRIADHLTPVKKASQLSGVIAMLLVGISAVSIFVSQLATYDMPSFFFTIAGVERLLVANKSSKDGKTFFQAALLLFLGMITKIIVIPLILLALLFSFLFVRKKKRELFFWKSYLLLPLIVFVGMYVLLNYSAYITYIGGQIDREYVPPLSILSTFIEYLGVYVVFFVIGSLLLLYKRFIKLWFVLMTMSLIMLASHMLTNRLATLDKHAFAAVVPMSILFAVGVSEYLSKFELKPQFYLPLLTFVMFLTIFETNRVKHFMEWNNTTEVASYLKTHVVQGEKVLTQEGPPIMLALFDRNYPANVTTFDWFSYRGDEEVSAYGQAVRDGYFKYIEIQPSSTFIDSRGNEIRETVSQSLGDIYTLSFSNNGFLVYERNY